MFSKTATALFIGILSQQVLAEVPTQALTFNTNITITNATTSMQTKIRTAESLIKRVIASDEFRNRILNYTYNGKKAFYDNEGYSNAEVYQAILDGAERQNRIEDNEMDMNIQMYYENSSTVGWTSSGSTSINANTKFYNNYSAATITSNMTHEWLHKLGFSHSVYYSSSRDHSIPYAIGYIMREIAADIDDVEKREASGGVALQAPVNFDLYTTTSQVHLDWDPTPGAVSYKVYRRLSTSSTYYLQSTTTSTSFYQKKPNSDAYYYVRAVDSSGDTEKSETLKYDR